MVATCNQILDIINIAARRLGEKRGISTENATNAIAEMTAAYPIIRDKLIRSYNWACCIKEDTFAFKEMIVNPLYQDRQYVYALPSDYLGMVSFNGVVTGYSGTERIERDNPPYKIRGNVIYTNAEPPLFAEYKYRNDNVMSYDANFCDVLAWDIAIDCCHRIKQDESLLGRMMKMRDDAIDLALQAQAIETPARPKPTGNWLRARNIGYF